MTKKLRSFKKHFTRRALWGHTKNPVTVLSLLAMFGVGGYHLTVTADSVKLSWHQQQVDQTRDTTWAACERAFDAGYVKVARKK